MIILLIVIIHSSYFLSPVSTFIDCGLICALVKAPLFCFYISWMFNMYISASPNICRLFCSLLLCLYCICSTHLLEPLHTVKFECLFVFRCTFFNKEVKRTLLSRKEKMVKVLPQARDIRRFETWACKPWIGRCMSKPTQSLEGEKESPPPPWPLVPTPLPQASPLKQ